MHGGYAGHGGPWAIQYPLRWISEIYPKTKLPIAGSGGVFNPDDAVKYVLAGATVVQVCTAVYLQGYGVLKRLGDLAEEGKAALLAGDRGTFSRLMDDNFELRRSIQTISPANQEMIAAARACGASAKYAGSGGSIIGDYRDEAMLAKLKQSLEKIGAIVLDPIVA